MTKDILHIYYRDNKGKLINSQFTCPAYPYEHEVEACRQAVISELSYEDSYNLAVLALVSGGKA